tara:strand:- start:294 stop:446 length:153 start_codon:yes stop_codon:yes gene_type:complete
MNQEFKIKIIEYIQENVGTYNEDLCEDKYMEDVLDLVYEELKDELITKQQ